MDAHKILSDDVATAQQEFHQILIDDYVLLVVLGESSNIAFDKACLVCQGDQNRSVALWAKNPEAIREMVQQLDGQEKINFSEFGTRLFSNDYNNRVQVALGKSDSENLAAVLFALAVAQLGGQLP
jgi:hypothetical protein